ncbi:MAG: TIR domain-containing protein [bacterium]|nr:TIR domain-containing protein [bacterium]
MPRILVTYNRRETSPTVARFRREISNSDHQVSIGSGSLLQSSAAPADQIRAALPQIAAIVFLLGPTGLDPDRPGDLFTVREALRANRPVLLVLADGARVTPEFNALPTVKLTAQNFEGAIKEVRITLERFATAEPEPDLAAGGMDDLMDSNDDFAFEVDQDDYDLSGLGDLGDAEPAGAGESDSAESLAQEEIDALLNAVSSGEEDLTLYGGADAHDELRQEEIDALLQGTDDYSAPDETHPVAFAAYMPPEFDRAHRQSMFVYAHIADDPKIVAAVEDDARRFRDELGGAVPEGRRARHRAKLRPGTRVTVVPECEDLLFDPPELTRQWRGDWSRFEFEILLPETQDQANTTGDGATKPSVPANRFQTGEVALIRVSIRVAEIEIAHINCSSVFIEKHSNPLAAARAERNATARLYQRIFVSYSRRDFEVTRSYQAAQLALGNEVFVDSESIRSGENWRAALAAAIDSADVMQLFWSKHSARSQNVRDEWEYALQYRCPDDACANFLRPVYWKTPLPAVPAELNHLHFKLVDLQNR